MNGASYIDKTGIDLTHASVEERADLWSDYLRPFHDVSVIGRSVVTDPPRVNAWLLGKVVLCEASFGSAVRHHQKKHLSNDFDEFLCLDMRRKGVQFNDFGSEAIKLAPGDVTVFDYSNIYRCRATAVGILNLFVSHSAIGYDPGRHPRVIRLRSDSVIQHVLSRTILGLFSVLNRTTKAEAEAISRGLIGLLQGILFDSANTMPPSFATARSRAIREYIEQNLVQHKLNANQISARFHISRATIYRDFKEDGGLERYIVARKLEAALDALCFGPRKRGIVSQTAEQWGFASVGNFSREFRRRFGFFPGEVVGDRQHTNGAETFPVAIRDERKPNSVVEFMRTL